MADHESPTEAAPPPSTPVTRRPSRRGVPRYIVKSVVHSWLGLTAFRQPDEQLTLREVRARTGLPGTVVFRHLQTLRYCGVLDQIGKNLYAQRPVDADRLMVNATAFLNARAAN